MLEADEGCREFRETLHRYLDQELGLINQVTFVGHLASCGACRHAFLLYNNHIQAHRILAAGGQLDAEMRQSLDQHIPSEFALISEKLVRKRARELGRLKFEINQVYLKHILAGHVHTPPGLSAQQMTAAQAASHRLLDNLERFKESSVIFADGGVVDLCELRDILDHPLDSSREGLEPQLRYIARGFLTARALDPSLDEYVLQHLGVILEELGHYEEARRLFLTLARLTPKSRPHLRSKALNSAARTSFRHLSEFEVARRYLEEAAELWPNRWTIEYNLTSLYLWPANPHRDLELAALHFQNCVRFAAEEAEEEGLHHLLEHDATVRGLLEKAGLLSLPGGAPPSGARA